MGLEKKQIAVICNYELLPERVGGMDYFFWEFNKLCNLNQIQIDWFFPNTGSHGGYNVFNIIPANHEGLEKSALKYLKTTNRDYSHVFTHFLELCTSFFCELKKKTSAKIIAVDHNPRPLNGYTLKKRLKKRLKGLMYSKCIDQFIGVSKYTTKEILNDFGSGLSHKTSVIYNGVIIDDIQINKNRRETFPKFLVVSHLRASKGIQDLIKAVNLLPDFIKNEIKIDVYGEGPYQDELILKVKSLSLKNVFSFKGSVANLNEIYCKYDYMLQPTHMECFSLSILESLAANIPVITTNVGGNEEVVTHEDNGYIFEAKDIFKLKDILESVFIGEKGIKTNTRNLIEDKFSIDLMVENYMKLLA